MTANTSYKLKALFFLSVTTFFLFVVWLASKDPCCRHTVIAKPWVTRYESDLNKSTGPQFMWTKNVRLCIMFNLKNMSPNKQVIYFMLSYYSYFFNHIMLLFDGEWSEKPDYLPKNIKFSGCKSTNGWYQHYCLRICLNETWNEDGEPEGYLYIADDMFVNLTKMSLLPLSKVWCIRTTNINYTARASLGNSWHWGRALRPLETVVTNLPAKWKQVLVKYAGFPNCLPARATSDIIYVPHWLAGNITYGINYVIKTAHLIHEVALPLVVNIIAPTDQVHFEYGYLWGNGRTMDMIKKKARRAHFVHPIKLSSRPRADLWESFMEQVKAAANGRSRPQD